MALRRANDKQWTWVGAPECSRDRNDPLLVELKISNNINILKVFLYNYKNILKILLIYYKNNIEWGSRLAK
jgi:hypothetical protein